MSTSHNSPRLVKGGLARVDPGHWRGAENHRAAIQPGHAKNLLGLSIMTTPDKTLLILGIVLFAALLVALFVQLAKGKNIAPILAFFILPIGMIGFSEIKSMKGPWGEIVVKSISDFGSNPNDSNNIAAVNQTIDQIETVHVANPDVMVPPQIHSNLVATAKMLKFHTLLSPESRLALSRIQFVLGETNDAATTVNSIVKANTNLLHMVNPKLRFLVKPISISK